MNIIVLDRQPVVAAQYLCDQHLKDSIAATTTVVSTVCGGSGEHVSLSDPYVVWTKRNISNFMWMHRFSFALCEEYRFRFNRPHSFQHVVHAAPIPFGLRGGKRSEFICNVNPVYRGPETVDGYRNFYVDRCVGNPDAVWTKRQPPHWIHR